MIKILLAIFFSLSLTACGWHLRTQADWPRQLSQLHIDNGIPKSFIAQQLTTLLTNAGVNIVHAKHAPVLHLLSEHFSQATSGISTAYSNQISTITLTYQLTYSITDHENNSWITPRTITEQRTLSADPNQVLGADNVQLLLKQEMMRSAIDQLLNQLILWRGKDYAAPL